MHTGRKRTKGNNADPCVNETYEILWLCRIIEFAHRSDMKKALETMQGCSFCTFEFVQHFEMYLAFLVTCLGYEMEGRKLKLALEKRKKSRSKSPARNRRSRRLLTAYCFSGIDF